MKVSNYYRKITVSLPQALKDRKRLSQMKPHFLEISTLFLVMLFVFLALSVITTYVSFQEARDRRQRAEDNYTYWVGVIERHPNLTDAYYNAGVYAYALGDSKKAVEYLRKAISLDPSFEKARELERVILKGSNS